MKFEEYSTELQYTARVCHQLFVHLGYLEEHVAYIADDEVINDDIVSEQVEYMKKLLEMSGHRFKSLLQKETSICGLTFSDTYPFIESYPDWIDELFPYHRDSVEEDEIIQNGGSMINFDVENCINQFAVESSVPDSFVVVWYPIAAQVASPGFVWKSGPKNWLAYGLEQ